MANVNRNEFAGIIGKSPKWVGNLIDAGLPHEGGGARGKPMVINTELAINWLIEREVKKQIGDLQSEDGAPIEGTKDGEELLLTMAKRRKADVDAAKAEQSVIDLEDIGQFLYSISTLYGSELNSLGARLASEVAQINEPAMCKHRIDSECRRVRAATAERLRGFVAEYRAQQRNDGGCEAIEECGELGD
ncbi:terminase small subunit [Shewanella baltica]|jgi:phage terminase Nu1 subunit (DNA packaging protein)|uniref:terminase small subunit n=1 Tax=Shewanella baltica TaxID=62322 RepID=UPI00217F1764|nr:terminase small subunit [Shewanella baltica]MCS6237129.1 terminase small subunit [Shewanella baltica]MCS6272551.1 terminase small subunit [Shewanella baltica]